MRQLDATATAAALPWAPLIEGLADLCRAHAAGQVACPPRQVLPLQSGGSLLVMPAVGPELAITKLVTVHPDNPARGLPTILGEVVVMDSASGARLALLDGPTLTARRTAAVSLLAQRLLAPAWAAAPREVLIVGGGVQARVHAEALRALHPGARLWVQGRTQAPDFAAVLGIEPLPPGPAAQQARRWDLILCATTSREPVLAPGVGEAAGLVIGVGAFRHDMVELPPALLRQAQVFVDDPEGARAEAGDLLAAGLCAGAAPPLVSLQDLVLGQRPADDGRPRVFKSVGCARWDLAAAQVAWDQLRAAAS
jgi:ornithine cyclodeaminase/alanine dehydrogenase-like protein (mu-crystallin family)